MTTVLLFSLLAGCDGYVLHEWGTFTVLHDGSGAVVSGIRYDEEALPRFVYAREADDPASVKMETPVIYVYSPVGFRLDVKVGFPQGSFTHYYPRALLASRLCWLGVDVLPPGEGRDRPPQVPEGDAWEHARHVDANVLRAGNGEHERFLFYRGLASFRTRGEEASAALRNFSLTMSPTCPTATSSGSMARYLRSSTAVASRSSLLAARPTRYPSAFRAISSGRWPRACR